MNTQQVIDFLGINLITKATLAQELGVSKVTLHKYHDVALKIPDFAGDYPCVGGKFKTSHPLTDYQKWVLEVLLKMFKNKSISLLIISVKNSEIVDKYLSKNAYNFHNQQQSDNGDISDTTGSIWSALTVQPLGV